MAIFTKRGHAFKDPWVRIDYTRSDYRQYPWFSVVPVKGLADETQWPLAQTWIGAWFDVDVELKTLPPSFLELPLLNIHIEKYADGRVFSLAQHLRTVLGYSRELRVSGSFLLDQVAQLSACGINSFEIAHDADMEHALFILRQTPERAF